MRARAFLLAVLVGALAGSGPAWSAPRAAASAIARTGTPAAPAAEEDIRDIRGPIAIPPWWRWLALGGGAALAAGLTGAAVAWSRRRRERTAEERALDLLDQARALAEAGQPREYAGAASDAVRWYIEQRFGLRAAHVTTDEFLGEVAAGQAPALAARREALQQFLQACDLAKFARYALPREGMQTLHELARQFVLTAAEKPNAAQPAPGRVS